MNKKSASIFLCARSCAFADSARCAELGALFGEEYAASLNKKNSRAAADSLAGALLLADMLSALGLGGGRILRNSCGKPYFADRELSFSISHDGGMAVCALSDACEVGVDLMAMPPKIVSDKRLRLAERCFTASEAADIVSCGDDELFARSWTMREAIGKLIGSGVTPFFGKEIPRGEYAYEHFLLSCGNMLGFISLCKNDPHARVNIINTDPSALIFRKI